MKKIFLFLTAVLFTTCLWAADKYYILGAQAVASDGALTKASQHSNLTLKYIKHDGSNYTSTTDISFSATNGINGKFASSDASANVSDILTSAKWGTGSGAAYAAGIKFAKSTTYTLRLGTKVISKISLLCYPEGKNSSVTIGDTEKTTSTKAWTLHEWTGSFTGDVSMVLSDANGIYGVFVLETPSAPAVTHTLTWDFAGGSCSATAGTNYTAGGDVAEGATITYPANNTMSKDGYDFNGWSTSVTTMPTSDLTITAQWIEHTTQSSDATLSALSVAGCTLSPAFASGTTAYTIALPFYASMPAVGDVTATKNDSYAKDPEVSIADNVISIACEAEDGTKQTYTITVNIADVPAASTSINIEQLVLDNSKSYSYTTALTDAHISSADLNGLDSLAIGDADHSRPDYNESFLGLKIKKQGGYIQMVIPAGKTLKVKFGSVAADLKLTINDVPQTDISKSTSVYEHTATGNELIKIATSSGGTVVIKQIMIDEDIAVVRPFEATIAATTNGTASVELAKYAKGEEVTVNCVPASDYKLASIAVSGCDDKGAETDVTVTGNKFTMPGSPVTITVTFSIATSISNTSDSEKAQKRIENGQLVIEKNEQVFNAMGQTIR